MTKLGVLCGAAWLALGGFAACSGDEKVKRDQDAEAGGAGAPAGGADSVDAGGSSSQPTAGQGPAPQAGAGGDPPLPGSGGAGGAEAAQGGAGGAAGGAAPTYDCPAQPGSFTYECALVEAAQEAPNWTPSFDFATATFHLNVSALPFPIASGTVSYIYNAGDAQYCGSVDVIVVGNDVTATIPNPQPNIYEATIVDFKLTDVCEQHQDYDPVGVACWQLMANAESGNQLECTGAGDPCPAQCQ